MLLKAANTQDGGFPIVTLELRSGYCGHYTTHVFVTQHHPDIGSAQAVYDHALEMWQHIIGAALTELDSDELAHIDILESELD